MRRALGFESWMKMKHPCCGVMRMFRSTEVQGLQTFGAGQMDGIPLSEEVSVVVLQKHGKGLMCRQQNILLMAFGKQ